MRWSVTVTESNSASQITSRPSCTLWGTFIISMSRVRCNTTRL